MFLQLKEHATVKVLGTVTGQDPETHKLLVASITQSIKQEKHEDGNTNVYPKKNVTATAGSAAQLDRVGKELMTTAVLTGTTNSSVTLKRDRQLNEAGLSNSAGKPMVNTLPFEVRLVRLTQQEILKYTRKRSPSEIPQSGPERSSPIRTRSMRFRPLSTHSKKRTISDRLTQWLISKISTFTIRSHNLCRCKQKLNLKCRIKGCTLAYVSFNTFKDLNAHHHIYHPGILFKCPSCSKLFATPSTWRNHKYGCTRQKLFKCNSCKKRFLFNSTQRQHNRSHICQKLYKCFYGGCNK